MHKQDIFDAINQSQDGSPLRKFLLAQSKWDDNPINDWSFTDALNCLLFRAWREAGDSGELLSHLRYATEQLRLAAEAVRPFANAEEDASV